ncbi:MAG: prolipoprotein diacylglyceryl transferase [Candidatus Limnocylindria bacterium]
MSGIVIGIDPVALQIGHFMLRWYSIFFGLAILAGVWVGVREAARRGLNVDQVQSLAMWSVGGGLIGARLFHVIDRWELYAADPLRAFALWEGGLAVYGGLIGGVLTGLAFALRKRLPVWHVADAAAPGMILGQGIGRLACIPNGDAIGAPAAVPWAFIYTNPASMVPEQLRGVPLHPYAVYELIFDLGLFALLWRLRSHPLFARPGTLFLFYVAAYSLGRFALSYYRVERVWFAGLQEAQVLSLAGLAAALIAATVLFARDARTSRPVVAAQAG